MAETAFIDELNVLVKNRWESIYKGAFFTYIGENQMDKDLYASFMYELYHYTRHNSINQAVAANATSPEDRGLLKFAYKHALEELGHENMVLADLKRVGVDPDVVVESLPLPPTNALTAFIYQTALNQGAKARLGYSFWAEDCYGYIDGLLTKIRTDLQLVDKDMSFFVAHSTIDEKHSEEVEEAIAGFVHTKEEMQAVAQVADTTLYLTGKLLDESLSRYLSGWSPKYLSSVDKAA
ncbi:iron-containing redox enzyme family protein [Sessilibacter corallicola]|uniref:iron-containing redox enzyme family protein n=1 Tax=Sessilibacter corallicola TaxID=2904075 RepID=UPI001E3E683F|nr:iron-containing redox enzyme family protein [Sessilibacter corallicola]MCE2028728.1 iron-containing redox enzyme family protein [Sessilibacter corallicola]